MSARGPDFSTLREGLRGALRSYRASGARDRAVVSRFFQLLERPDPSDRSGSDAHVTGSAVVARPRGDAFLLVAHRRVGRWLQPGGHVEPEDRSVFETALREAREETGIERFATPAGEEILDLDVHSIPAFEGDPPHLHFDVRYLLTVEDRGAAGDPARDRAVWFSPDDLGSIETDESLLRALRRAERRLDSGPRAIRRKRDQRAVPEELAESQGSIRRPGWRRPK